MGGNAGQEQIGVIGGGSWGTALAWLLAHNGMRPGWWVRDEKNRAYIREHGHNGKYLREAAIPANQITLHDTLEELTRQCRMIVLAVPAAFVRNTLKELSPELTAQQQWISAVKGMEPGLETTITTFLNQEHGIPSEKLAVISGPCHAEELIREMSAYLTLASPKQQTGEELAARFRANHVYVRWSPDLEGIEWASILKNIYAIASGIATGLGEGDNFKAVLVSASIREMAAFLEALHPGKRQIWDEVYAGDLMVTCYSQFSRNRTLGNMIGQGYSLESAKLELKMVAEGLFAISGVRNILSTAQLDMPILETVATILLDHASPDACFESLKARL